MALRIWLNEKVGFHPTFSRHGIAQSLSALALRIWLNEKVGFLPTSFHLFVKPKAIRLIPSSQASKFRHAPFQPPPHITCRIKKPKCF